MKFRILIALLAVFVYTATRADGLADTELGRAAAALTVGQAAKFTAPGYDALPWRSDAFYYGDGAAWNPITKRIEFVASPVGGTPRWRYTYDVANNAWAVELMPWQGNGHGYDSNAVTDAGVHCFARYGDEVGCRQPDGSWVDLPNMPWQPGTVQALENWPGHGLILVTRAGLIALWNGAAWKNITGAENAWGNTGTWATAVGDVVYVGANSTMFRVSANADGDPVLTKMADPPWPMGNNQANHTTDGINLLVARVDGAAWAEFNGAGWVDRPDLVSNAIRNQHHYYVVHIPELQIVVTMGARTPTLHEVWIIKTGGSAPPPPPPPALSCVPQAALPTEYWGLPLCSAEAPAPPVPPIATRDPCAQPGVFVCDRFDGKGVAGFIYPGSSGLTIPYVKDGALRFEIVSGGGKDPGHYRPLIPHIGEGETLAWSYGKRADAEAVLHDGMKDWILWAGASSYTDQQIVMSHLYEWDVAIPYRSGGVLLAPKIADGNFHLQQGDFDCWYRDAKIGKVAKCHTTQAGKWADYYIELRIGHFGQADTVLNQYVREEGGTWRKFVDNQPVLLPTYRPFEHFMLTSYMTNEGYYAHPIGYVDFRNFIMSRRPMDLALL